ncbi:MAG TPA: membrane dipeptidase [Bryobacteraceae bacterium]|nr:membrane dipeptidase [Bryobacteraceae bacterium]
MKRRQALQYLGAVPLLHTSLLSQTRDRADFLKQHPAFDLHCHPGLFVERGMPPYAGDQAFARTVADMRAGGLAAAFFSLVADARILVRDPSGKVLAPKPFAAGEAWADCEKQLRDFHELAGREKLTLAHGVRQMKPGQLTAFLSCEGGDCLEGSVQHVDDLYNRGVRSLQLVHYAQNNLGDSQTLPPVYHGLSSFGRDVVRRMNRLGVLVDVAHASFDTVKATVDLASAPIVLSHTHLQSQSAPHPRLITVEHARLVSSTGGVIGAWPSGFANHTFADFIDQTMRLVDAVGVDHVGLGTDMDGNFQPVFSNYRQLPDWIAGLRGKGLSEAEVAKIAGGNALRMIDQVCKE